jgi:hypothetical protein
MLPVAPRACRTCKRTKNDGVVVGDDGYCITCHPDGQDNEAGKLLGQVLHARRHAFDKMWVSVQGGPSGILWSHPSGYKVVEEVKADKHGAHWHLVKVTQRGKRPNPRDRDWVAKQFAPPNELIVPHNPPPRPFWMGAPLIHDMGKSLMARITSLYRPLDGAAGATASPPPSTIDE